MNAIDHYTQPEPDGDDDGLQLKARRLTTYSGEALRTAHVIDKLVVTHSDFRDGLAAMDRTFQLGHEFSVPKGLLLCGPPGSGKSTLIDYFQRSLPASKSIDPGMGAISIRLARSVALSTVVEAVLCRLDYPFPKVTSTTVGVKKGLSYQAVRRKGTRLIFVDEAHNLCRSSYGGGRAQGSGTALTNFFSELMDVARVGLCLVGGPDLARLADTDPFLASRCSARLEFSNFTLSGPWLGVVKAFIKQCAGVDLSLLDTDRQRKALHQATQGNLRSLKDLLTEMVLVAVDAGSRKLEVQLASTAFDRVFGSTARSRNPWAS